MQGSGTYTQYISNEKKPYLNVQQTYHHFRFQRKK